MKAGNIITELAYVTASSTEPRDLTEIKGKKKKLHYGAVRAFVVLKGNSDKVRVALK